MRSPTGSHWAAFINIMSCGISNVNRSVARLFQRVIHSWELGELPFGANMLFAGGHPVDYRVMDYGSAYPRRRRAKDASKTCIKSDLLVTSASPHGAGTPRRPTPHSASSNCLYHFPDGAEKWPNDLDP
jgi:prepilin-type processing-associated H-X9-DG protein